MAGQRYFKPWGSVEQRAEKKDFFVQSYCKNVIDQFDSSTAEVLSLHLGS